MQTSVNQSYVSTHLILISPNGAKNWRGEGIVLLSEEGKGPSTNDVRTEELLILRTKRLCEMWTMEGMGSKISKVLRTPFMHGPLSTAPPGGGRKGEKKSIHSSHPPSRRPRPSPIFAGRLTCGASGFGALSLSLPYQREREERRPLPPLPQP